MGRAAAAVATLRVGSRKGDRSDMAVALGFRRTWRRNMGKVVQRECAGAAWMQRCDMGAAMRGHGHMREKKKRMCGPQR